MCETCLNITPVKASSFKLSVNQYDPTRTMSIRNAFTKELNRRFTLLKKEIIQAVVTDDVFGIEKTPPANYQLLHTYASPGHKAYQFGTSSQKVDEFMKWVNGRVEAGILQTSTLNQVGTGANAAWTNLYIQDSYKRGVMRARYEMEKNGFGVPSMEKTGGIAMSMSTPFHIDRLGLMYSRTFSELKGVTSAMDQQISRILSQGMADGDGPRLLARKLVSTIDGSGDGTLGIKDTLGRFIPAQRRAEIMARTEIIRTHHQATIQEYRNWGVEGVNVMAEFKTAGDARVCEACASLEGTVWTLEQIEPMIPVHPLCFIDSQIPIYTSNGWKAIGKVEVGDLVLTHRKRFRKVYALPRHSQDNINIVTIDFGNGKKFTVTANHPVLVSKQGNSFFRWKEAGKITLTDKIVFLSNECARCGKSTPWHKKYCSRTCLSKDITDKQWANPEHRKNISKKNSISMNEQYASGERDRFEITKEANKKTIQMFKEGIHPLQQPENIERVKLVTNLPKHRKASSVRMKANNPMAAPMIREKATASLLNTLENHPEKRLNVRMAKLRKSGNYTWIEQRIADLLDKLGFEYISQYPILNYNIDFVLPDLNIAIECDGEYWHQDKEKDAIRQARIEDEGWLVLRYSGSKINKEIGVIEKELTRVVSNHTGEYHTMLRDIVGIKHWVKERKTKLYNLSVEEDESYIAKGVVVHNCRCITIPSMEKVGVKKYAKEYLKNKK